MKTFSSVKIGKTSLGAIIKKDQKSPSVRTERITVTDELIDEITEEYITIHHVNFEDCNFTNNVLSCVRFAHCTFSGCIFSDDVLLTSTFLDCEFFCSDFKDCIFTYCGFERCSFDEDCVIACTILRDCTFYITNFNNANVKRCNIFSNSDLSEAINAPYVKMACPTHGSFIGWKKVYDANVGYCLIKLEIPAKAKRSSATSRKCRAEYAKVLGVYNMHLEKINCKRIVNNNYARCVYKIGDIVYPDSFDEKRYNECSHGIHFFIDVNDAIEY